MFSSGKRKIPSQTGGERGRRRICSNHWGESNNVIELGSRAAVQITNWERLRRARDMEKEIHFLSYSTRGLGFRRRRGTKMMMIIIIIITDFFFLYFLVLVAFSWPRPIADEVVGGERHSRGSVDPRCYYSAASTRAGISLLENKSMMILGNSLKKNTYFEELKWRYIRYGMSDKR
jgi:hypothetical protein